MTVNLSGVANAQTITVSFSNVTDVFGQVLASTNVRASFLVGDTNADTLVNAGDALQTRSHSGEVTNTTNFRLDVNVDGMVDGGNALPVRAPSGTALPQPPPPGACSRENFDGVAAPALPAGSGGDKLLGQCHQVCDLDQ